MRKNSNKNLRINGEVQRVIAQAIRFSKDPGISPMTSVMDTIVAPDLKTCKVWISVMGDEEERAQTAAGLKRAAGYIRSVLAKELNLRYTPELTFIVDDSIEYAINMSKKIEEVSAHDRASKIARGEDPDAIQEESEQDDLFDQDGVY